MFSVKINPTTKQKMIIAGLLFAAIVAALFIFIISPVVNEIKNLNDQIYQQRLALEKRYVQRFGIRRVIQNFAEINEKKDDILSIFLSKNGEINFITRLEELADKSNVELKIFLLPEDEGKIKDGKQMYNLTLNLTGNFKNLLLFIKGMEKFDTYIILDSISITQKPDDEKDGAVSAILKGYVQKNTGL